MASILAETKNFFRLYRYICGESEVPDIYHFWSAVALLAAAVEDRVWYNKFKHERLYSNLFILLVGPSGLGKGSAISQAMRMADQSLSSINRYRGRVTHSHLIDHLGKPGEDANGQTLLANPKLWLIMDELQNDVGSNKKMIEEFVYLLTELYTASNYTVNTGTRTNGGVNIERPIINWLVGTTEECLRNIITKELLNSGFTARSCFIFGEYDFAKRYPRIKYPNDYDEIFAHLSARLWMLERTVGECVTTEAAEEELTKWYMTRPNPEEELLFSAWKRHHDLLLKFCMIFCLAEGGALIIQHAHVLQAQLLLKEVYKFSERLINIGTETFGTKPSNEMARYFRKFKDKEDPWIKHSVASRYMRAKKGINAEEFRKAIWALSQEGTIKIKRDKKTGANLYAWARG